MSRRFAEPKQEKYTDGMCVCSRNRNQEEQMKILTAVGSLFSYHWQEKHPAKMTSEAAGGAGLGGEACDIWVDAAKSQQRMTSWAVDN